MCLVVRVVTGGSVPRPLPVPVFFNLLDQSKIAAAAWPNGVGGGGGGGERRPPARPAIGVATAGAGAASAARRPAARGGRQGRVGAAAIASEAAPGRRAAGAWQRPREGSGGRARRAPNGRAGRDRGARWAGGAARSGAARCGAPRAATRRGAPCALLALEQYDSLTVCGSLTFLWNPPKWGEPRFSPQRFVATCLTTHSVASFTLLDASPSHKNNPACPDVKWRLNSASQSVPQ